MLTALIIPDKAVDTSWYAIFFWHTSSAPQHQAHNGPLWLHCSSSQFTCGWQIHYGCRGTQRNLIFNLRETPEAHNRVSQLATGWVVFLGVSRNTQLATQSPPATVVEQEFSMAKILVNNSSNWWYLECLPVHTSTLKLMHTGSTQQGPHFGPKFLKNPSVLGYHWKSSKPSGFAETNHQFGGFDAPGGIPLAFQVRDTSFCETKIRLHTFPAVIQVWMHVAWTLYFSKNNIIEIYRIWFGLMHLTQTHREIPKKMSTKKHIVG